MDPDGFGGAGGAWVGEGEVGVARVGRVVVLVVRQQGGRMVMVLVVVRRTRQRRGGVCARESVTVQIWLRGREGVGTALERRRDASVAAGVEIVIFGHQSFSTFDDVPHSVNEALLF